MKPFYICFDNHSILVNQLQTNDYQLLFNDEIIAVITPKMKGGEILWQSPNIEFYQSQLIGSIISSSLINNIKQKIIPKQRLSSKRWLKGAKPSSGH